MIRVGGEIVCKDEVKNIEEGKRREEEEEEWKEEKEEEGFQDGVKFQRVELSGDQYRCYDFFTFLFIHCLVTT